MLGSPHAMDPLCCGVFTPWSFTLWSLYSPGIATLVSPHSMESPLYRVFTLGSLQTMESSCYGVFMLWSLYAMESLR